VRAPRATFKGGTGRAWTPAAIPKHPMADGAAGLADKHAGAATPVCGDGRASSSGEDLPSGAG